MTLLLPARVPYWHTYGGDGPAMKRLFADLRIDADKHPSLWRLPLWVTGCQNASEMDKQGWQYDDVLTLCKAVVVQKKWECRHSIRQMERKVFRIVYVLPEVKPAEIVQLSLGLGVAA